MTDDVTHGLTLRQPWASAMFDLGKRIENRSRGPGVRHLGRRIAIHAGAGKDPEGDLQIERMGLAPAFGTPRPVRAILGTARLIAVLNSDRGAVIAPGWTLRTAELLTDEQVARWAIGPFWWLFDDVRKFHEPIPWARGQLGIWTLLEEAAVVGQRAAGGPW